MDFCIIYKLFQKSTHDVQITYHLQLSLSAYFSPHPIYFRQQAQHHLLPLATVQVRLVTAFGFLILAEHAFSAAASVGMQFLVGLHPPIVTYWSAPLGRGHE